MTESELETLMTESENAPGQPTPAQALELLAEELQLRASILALARRMADNEGNPFDNLDQLSALQDRLESAELLRKALNPAHLRAQAAALAEREAEVERLRVALEFYADENNLHSLDGNAHMRLIDGGPFRTYDRGFTARQALTPTQEAQQ